MVYFEKVGDDEEIQVTPDTYQYNEPHGIKSGVKNIFKTIFQFIFEYN